MADQTIAPVTAPQVSSVPVSAPTEQPTAAKAEPGTPETSGSVGNATPTVEQGKKLYLLA